MKNTKQPLKVLFKANICILTVFLIVLGALFFSKAAKGQVPEEYNVTGWSWIGAGEVSEDKAHIGWVSLNCYNYFDGAVTSHCDPVGRDYGLNIDSETGDISGYIWNGIEDQFGALSGTGWINFDPEGFIAEPGHSAKVEIDGPNQGQVSGWARIKSLKEEGEKWGYDDWGWVLMGPKPGSGHYHPGTNPNAPGVFIDLVNGDVSGWAWSGGHVGGNLETTLGLGWIWFDAGETESVYNPESHELEGWAWIGNRDNRGDPSHTGWISLNCLNDEETTPGFCSDTSNYHVKINLDTGDFEGAGGNGYAWIGSGFDTADDDSMGWIDFSPNPYPAEPNYTAKVFLDQTEAENDPYGTYKAGDIVGWARISVLQQYGEEIGFEDWGWLKLHRTGDKGYYGLALDFGEEAGEGGRIGGRCYLPAGCEGDARYLDFIEKGYAWSGGGQIGLGESTHDVGFGWIMFDAGSQGLGPQFVAPFINVEGGSIYARGDVGSGTTFVPPPTELGGGNYWYNATYMIVSGGDIVHFCTAEGEENNVLCSDTDYIKENIDDPFSPPLAENRYTSALGKIDVNGLVPDSVVNGGEVVNKYGFAVKGFYHPNQPRTVSDISYSGDDWSDGHAELQGVIYYINQDFIIDQELTFEPGQVYSKNGAGLIIVEKNLFIKKNTKYSNTPLVNSIQELPSVAWLVKGDIIIDQEAVGDVAEMAGVYISVGTATGGGNISTGHVDNTLKVYGAMIARSFDFQRTGIGSLEHIEPAEQIINDGRAGANTPPGLQDFSLAFPVIRQVAPMEVLE